MKLTFIKMLPAVVALLLAASCSKDSDSNDVINPENRDTPEATTPVATSEPFTITVVKGANTLSKATVSDDGTTLTQQFIDGDVLVISGDGLSTSEETVLTLKSTNEDKTEAVFSGELQYAEGKSASDLSTLNAVLRNNSSEHPNSGTALPADEIQQVSSLAEGFEKYGYLTATGFQYQGNETKIEVVQNTAFLEILVPTDVKSVNVNRHIYPVTDGKCYFAVANGTEIESNLLKKKRTIDIADGKVVKTIDRSSGVDALPGIFSVSAEKQVFFSKGNLQYQVGSDPAAWRFAEHQYSVCHKTNDNVGGNYSSWNNKWTDLFGWVGESSTVLTEGVAIYGVSTSSSTSDYVSKATDALKAGDWGYVFGKNSPWRTLTGGETDAAEWFYLFGHHTYGKGSVGGMNGVILFPDDWTYPTLSSSSTSESNFSTKIDSGWPNSYTADDWALMEANGAVFLPAASYRIGVGVRGVGDSGRFWSSSPSGSYGAWSLRFLSDGVNPDFAAAVTCGLSVRLVRPL